jgi:serpin B
MHSDWNVPYYENDDFSMISLAFKSSEGEGKYAMAFLLPKEGGSVSELLSSLDADAFTNALSGLTTQEVKIKLPKFEYSFFTSMSDTLKSLGMQRAFDYDTADFSPITNSDNELFVYDVLHKCYIRVDELGAEAAAVTAVVMTAGMAPPAETATFYADRPFVFAIYSVEDGTIAFLGAVNDPSQE